MFHDSFFSWIIIFGSWQETVIQNLSRRCGGFLKRLGLKGCKSVGDGALRYDLCTAFASFNSFCYYSLTTAPGVFQIYNFLMKYKFRCTVQYSTFRTVWFYG